MKPAPKPRAKRKSPRKFSSIKPPTLAHVRAYQAKTRTTIKKKQRPAGETLRIFGPVARRQWFKSQPCFACLTVERLADCGEVEQAHVTDDGTKGMGRRSGFRCIVPLGRKHHLRFDRRLAPFDTPENREWVERHAERYAEKYDQLNNPEIGFQKWRRGGHSEEGK